jgi:hypothetical protein
MAAVLKLEVELDDNCYRQTQDKNNGKVLKHGQGKSSTE